MRNVLRCHQAHAELSQLPPGIPLSETLKSHFETCEHCRSEWDLRVHAHLALSHHSERQAVPRPDSSARLALMEKIRAEAAEQPPQKQVAVANYRRPVLAMGAAMAVAAVWVGTHRGEELPSPVQPNTAVARNGVGTTSPLAQPIPTLPAQKTVVATLSTGAQSTSVAVSVPSLGAAKPPTTGRNVAQPSLPTRNAGTTSVKPGKAQPVKSGSKSIPLRPSSDDMAYINTIPMVASVPSRPRMAVNSKLNDDFITIPLPQVAATDTPATRQIVGDAIKQYQEEKAVVDTRLFQKVDLQMKGADLRELCESLTQKTGVTFTVPKELEDLKLTVLEKGAPVRDVMRQVVRLFNLQWRRRGEEGKYRYDLAQDLKQKLAEEELKRKDNDQMLLNVVDGMEPYVQYKDTPKEQLQSLAEEAKQKMASAGSVEERDKWRKQARMFTDLQSDRYRAAVEYFAGLSAEQLVSLGNGGHLTTQFNASDTSLSPDAARQIQQEMLKDVRDKFGSDLRQRSVDGVDVDIQFFLDHDRPDQISLVSSPRVVERGTHRGINSRDELANGEPDRLRDPGNTAAHVALQSKPEYRQKTTLAPESSSSTQAKTNPNTLQILQAMNKDGVSNFDTDGKAWVDSADVLAEIHQKTGRNIIADYYTRVYPKGTFSTQGSTLLVTLNNTADVLKSEWQEDGGFLRFRRFNYYTERTMDVPNRLLHRLKASRDARGYLNLDDLADASSLSYAVLEHQELGMALLLKYGFDEIPLVRNAKQGLMLYAKMDPLQRQQAQSPEGVETAQLMPVAKDLLRGVVFDARNVTDDQLAHGRYHIHLRNPGAYEWFDEHKPGRKSLFPAQPDVREINRETAVAKVEQVLKARGLNPEESQDTRRLLFGPGAGIWSQAQFGDRYVFQETGPLGMHNGDGQFKDVGQP